MGITRACPLFPSRDIGASVRYYRDKLGFTQRLVMDGYGIVERDGAEIHFWPCDNEIVLENTSAYFRVEDIANVRASMDSASEGGRISEPQVREWGMREFYVWDVDGNLLRFGESIAE